ncbi:MAG: hypothetical protein ACRBHB_17245 [Arenicella sp.]
MKSFICMLITAISVSLVGCNQSRTENVAEDVIEKTPSNEFAILSAKGLDPLAGEASPEGRLLIGRGEDYVPINEDPQELFKKLKTSVKYRRDTAWSVVEDMLKPIPLEIDGKKVDVPIWHTWYEGAFKKEDSEVFTKLKLFYAELNGCDADPGCDDSKEEIAKRVMGDSVTKNFARQLTAKNFTQKLRQTVAAGSNENTEETLGQGFTIFSPSFVEHVLTQSDDIASCAIDIPAGQAPPSDDQFSPCIKEFPRSAVMVKTAWEEITNDGVNNHATDGNTVKSVMTANGEGTWLKDNFDKTVPATNKIYTVETNDSKRYGLTAIHFSTKDTREWLWISLWWHPNADNDFGQDRPTSITQAGNGVWGNYKMCVTSSFVEGDQEPWKAYAQENPSLAKVLKASYEESAEQSTVPGEVTSWCSNPILEHHKGNARTNCIGCHQYSFTTNPHTNKEARFLDTYNKLYEDVYPDYGRQKNRINFPAEFAWSFGMEFRPQIECAKNNNC